MDLKWIEVAETKGWPWLLALIMVGYVIYHFRKLEPRLTEIESFVRIMQTTVNQNTMAMNTMAQSTDNVAHTLKLLDQTLEGNIKLMQSSVDSDKLTQKWLKDHDDRAEKMYTMLRVMEQERIQEDRNEHKNTT